MDDLGDNGEDSDTVPMVNIVQVAGQNLGDQSRGGFGQLEGPYTQWIVLHGSKQSISGTTCRVSHWWMQASHWWMQAAVTTLLRGTARKIVQSPDGASRLLLCSKPAYITLVRPCPGGKLA